MNFVYEYLFKQSTNQRAFRCDVAINKSRNGLLRFCQKCFHWLTRSSEYMTSNQTLFYPVYVRNTVLQDMQITVDIDLQEQKAHYL